MKLPGESEVMTLTAAKAAFCRTGANVLQRQTAMYKNGEGRECEMKKRAKYRKELARAMYSYFINYSEPLGAPSFAKFARSIGVTVRTLEGFRKKREFDESWRECNEIRRDYLIDNALCKRFDSSFAKFIYSLEFSPESESADEEMRFVLRVLGEENDL